MLKVSIGVVLRTSAFGGQTPEAARGIGDRGELPQMTAVAQMPHRCRSLLEPPAAFSKLFCFGGIAPGNEAEPQGHLLRLSTQF